MAHLDCSPIRTLITAVLISLAPALACAGGGASIEAIPPQEVAVLETLQVPLRAINGNPGLGWGVAGVERATVSGNGTGGLFQWSPLSSQVGTHEVEIQLLNGSSVVHSRVMVVTVLPASDAAPIFISPGAGRTYDLERDRCVTFDVEVRDEDTPDVTIQARAGTLPEGASLDTTGPKQAKFEWCPEPDQVAATERWTIGLEADDGSHEPTAQNFVIVLRSGTKEGCPGAAPVITVVAPSEGARVGNRGGYLVEARVSDDMGLRDAPLLYYSTAMPDDPEKPDVTEFEQLPFTDDDGDGTFRARVPSLGLDEGEEQAVFFVVSATDNDDPAGTLCDHRIDSALYSFVALGGASAGGLGTCETCTSSLDCDSGLCATAATGARCIPRCDGGASCSGGTCGSRTSAEGGVAEGCGSVSDLCDGSGGSGSCTDDSHEPNDSIADAATAPSSFSDGQVCAHDDDYYRIAASTGTELTVTIDGFIHSEGDLDLQLLSRTGTILASSGGVTNSESLSHCVPSATEVFAKVSGFLGDENSYSMRVDTAPGSCCLDDAGEDDDSRAAARSLSGASFDGTICPSDDDYIRFDVTEPTGVAVTIVFDGDIDLDLELYGPSGSVVDSSRGITDSESVEVDLFEAGTYTIRVYGYSTDFGDYLGEVRFTTFSGCIHSSECTTGEVCEGGTCLSDACTSDTDCPSSHICPPPGPSGPVSHCGESCRVNADCKSTEACKWFREGRYCGVRGGQANGGTCSNFGDCGGQRTCVDWAGGYCARVGCSSNSDCETGTYCVAEGGINVCALGCWDSEDLCRLSSGYRCGVRNDLATYSQYVCIPR